MIGNTMALNKRPQLSSSSSRRRAGRRRRTTTDTKEERRDGTNLDSSTIGRRSRGLDISSGSLFHTMMMTMMVFAKLQLLFISIFLLTTSKISFVRAFNVVRISLSHVQQHQQLERVNVRPRSLLAERNRNHCSLFHHSFNDQIGKQSCMFMSSSSAGNGDGDGDGGIGVGIDLGTTNSAVAYLDTETNQPCIVEIPNNGRTVKSIVTVQPEESVASSDVLFRSAMVGSAAIEWERRHEETAYRHVKRVIGTGSTFLSTQTRQVVPHVAPPTRKSNDDDNHSDDDYVEDTNKKNKKSKKKKPKKKKKKDKAPTLQRRIDDARENPVMLYPLQDDTAKSTESRLLPLVSPETISSCIIQRLLDVATNHTQQQISRAVIGIPAYFNDEQREATTRAAKACGLTKVKLLPEPEAAALAYGVDKKQSGGEEEDDEEELVLVFDLGGGTYDVSILLVERGLTEIICTSGNAQLGGTNFDAKIATYLSKLISGCCKSEDAKDAVIRSAEAIRIYLSNHRSVQLVLPLTQDGWLSLADGKEVIETSEDNEGGNNTTHLFHKWTRREMERLCSDEFQSLLQPIREVAIMAGALLPGDARPSIVETALELEASYSDSDESFYGNDEDADEDNFIENQEASGPSSTEESQRDVEDIPQEVLDFAAAKKMQQKGRKKARRVAKDERKFKAEQRRVATEASTTTVSGSSEKVQGDGITGRPISRVVLVGGATRMPAIGKIISSVVGVVPQKTVDPDEAVALGCAVHVGVLDGMEGSGVVLNSMQAAILRAVAEKDLREGGEMTNRLLGDDGFDDDDFFDDEEFTTIEYI